MRKRTWGAKTVTHLVIVKVHTPTVGSQRMALVIEFKAVGYVCVSFPQLHPWVHFPCCVVLSGNVIHRRGFKPEPR